MRTRYYKKGGRLLDNSIRIIPAVIDLETTGLSFIDNEILEIAIIPLDEKTLLPLQNKFTSYIIPDHPENINKKALEINKIVIDDIPKELTKSAVKEDLKKWICSLDPDKKVKLKLIGHNIISFDINFLKVWFNDRDKDNACEYDKYFFYVADDTMQWARLLKASKLINIKSCSLTNLIQYYNIPKDLPEHRAENDCLYTLEVYKKLVKSLKPSNIIKSIVIRLFNTLLIFFKIRKKE